MLGSLRCLLRQQTFCSASKMASFMESSSGPRFFVALELGKSEGTLKVNRQSTLDTFSNLNFTVLEIDTVTIPIMQLEKLIRGKAK